MILTMKTHSCHGTPALLLIFVSSHALNVSEVGRNPTAVITMQNFQIKIVLILESNNINTFFGRLKSSPKYPLSFEGGGFANKTHYIIFSLLTSISKMPILNSNKNYEGKFQKQCYEYSEFTHSIALILGKIGLCAHSNEK